MLIPTLLFLLGLLFLIKGGDWFVDGATGIAHRFHLPEILIGATVVSIGTTLPEVMVSASSALSGHCRKAGPCRPKYIKIPCVLFLPCSRFLFCDCLFSRIFQQNHRDSSPGYVCHLYVRYDFPNEKRS